LLAGHLARLDVRQQQMNRAGMALTQTHRVGAALGFQDLETLPIQCQPDDGAHGGLVLDQKDGFGLLLVRGLGRRMLGHGCAEHNHWVP